MTSRELLAAARDEIAARRLDASIEFVFCNRAQGEDPTTDGFLRQVRSYGLNLVTLSSRDFRKKLGERPARKGQPLPEWRREYDRAVMEAIDGHTFDLGMLAGYMLIFGEEATARWDLLNLHPAAPGGPKGIWQDVIWELIASGAERAGVMIHLATPQLDEGPVVTYCTYSIRGPDFAPLWRDVEGKFMYDVKAMQGENNPLFRKIREEGVARELPLVIETLKAFAEGRISIRQKTPVNDVGRPLIAGLDLTQVIEQARASGSR
jgi:folate-dependent phosphoribosylglycinamide formyltransferase PurN